MEAGDAKDIEVGEKVTLMKWGNANITKKEVSESGEITLTASLNLEDQVFKGTKKITWIAVDPSSNFEVTLVELDHLITKKKVDENEKVQDIVNHNSRIAYQAIAEGNMKTLKHGDVIQLERRGYFYVDKAENNTLTLNFIPDGRSSNMSKIESKLDQKQVAGGKTDKKVDESKSKKKQGGAVDENGEVKLSKKELNKLKKKENKANLKANKGDAPTGN